MSERARIAAQKTEAKKENSVSQIKKTDYSQSVNSPIDQILSLQRTIGNQAVQRLFNSGVIQAKLTIGKPNDIYEQEADRVADEVMRMPEPQVQRQNEEEEREEEELVQAKPIGDQIILLMQRQIEPEEEAIHAKAEGQTSKITPNFETKNSSRLSFGTPYLQISKPNDKYEQEANRVADTVISMPEAAIQQKVTPQSKRVIQRKESNISADWWCEENEAEPSRPYWWHNSTLLNRKVEDNHSAEPIRPNFKRQISSLRSSGNPLGSFERNIFESKFGADFSDVRIHTNSWADQLARGVKAQAFTIGNNIVFRKGLYSPYSRPGKHLLAHELTHVIQQSSGRLRRKKFIQRTIGDGHDLTSPRFSGNVILEGAYDNERLIRRGSSGEHVRRIQESLIAMGYSLPRSTSRALPGRADGVFGPETEAAIRRFQADAGAVKIDGIVGPETIGLLDTHDVGTPTPPPAITGPVPGPRGGCAAHFAGVTFNLSNQVAAGVNNAANINIVTIGGNRALWMRGQNPITYSPHITINAPNNAKAQEFRVGLAQNLLSSARIATYSSGATASTVVPTLPIKDGSPADYHPIFVTGLHAGVVEDFSTNGQNINLTWPDVPADAFFINFRDNPTCPATAPAQTMTNMLMHDRFRIWVVVRHRQSGCVRSLHHVDWNLRWIARVFNIFGVPSRIIVSNVNNVAVANGNGSPRYIQGGPVPGSIAQTICSP